MKRRAVKQDPFEPVRKIGLALPDVEAGTKYDGSPVLKAGGSFMAGLATHRSAEPETLVVRIGFEERECLLEDAPDRDARDRFDLFFRRSDMHRLTMFTGAVLVFLSLSGAQPRIGAA